MQADEDAALLGPKEEEQEEQEVGNEPCSDDDESSDGGGFGFQPTPCEVKQEEVPGKGPKACVKTKAAKPRSAAKARGAEAPQDRKIFESAEQTLAAMRLVTPLDIWQSGEKQAKDLESRLSKALKMSAALEDAGEDGPRLAADLKKVTGDISEWTGIVSNLQEHAALMTFEVPEQIVDDMIEWPAASLTTILTDVAQQIMEATLLAKSHEVL